MVVGEYRLFDEILKLSESKDIHVALREWNWTNTYMIDYGVQTCLCGHPIAECCEITHKLNGKSVIVGNCCINKLMETESDLIFQALKRVKADNSNSFNPATIEYVHSKHIINDWEYGFYNSIMHKRKLWPKQYQTKLNINNKILRRLCKHVQSKKAADTDKALFNF